MELPDLAALGDKPIWKDLDKFQDFMAKFTESLTDPAKKQHMANLLGQLQQARGEAEQLAPGVVTKMHEDATALQGQIDSMSAQVAQEEANLKAAQQEFEKQRYQPVPPTPPPEAPVDPGLAPVLGGELLNRFGKRPAAATEQEHGSVWSHFDGVDEAAAAPPPAPPAQHGQKTGIRRAARPAVHEDSLWGKLGEEEAKRSEPPRDDLDQSERGL